MATKKSTSAPATSATPAVNTPTIPAAVRPAAPAAKPSGASLLAGLTGKAKTAKPKAAAKERPSLPLTAEQQETYGDFAAVKQLYDVFEARLKSIKGELEPELFEAWLTTFWKNRSVPSNPALQASVDGKVDAEGIYIVQERFKTQIPDNEDPTGSVAELLKKLGLDDQKAEDLVANEVDFSPQIGLKAFNELVSGHYEDKQFVEASAAEQAVGQKILEFVQNQLTEDEQALVLQNTPKTVIKKGFLARAVNYASTQEQLAAIFKVFVPVNYPKGAKFGVSDSPVERTSRLLDKANEVLGGAPESDEEDDD